MLYSMLSNTITYNMLYNMLYSMLYNTITYNM